MTRKKKPRFVEVHWQDAISIATWVAADNLEKEARTPDIVSRGWLLVENDRQIIIAGTISSSEVGEVIGIPKGMLIKVRTLKT